MNGGPRTVLSLLVFINYFRDFFVMRKRLCSGLAHIVLAGTFIFFRYFLLLFFECILIFMENLLRYVNLWKISFHGLNLNRGNRARSNFSDKLGWFLCIITLMLHPNTFLTISIINFKRFLGLFFDVFSIDTGFRNEFLCNRRRFNNHLSIFSFHLNGWGYLWWCLA